MSSALASEETAQADERDGGRGPSSQGARLSRHCIRRRTAQWIRLLGRPVRPVTRRPLPLLATLLTTALLATALSACGSSGSSQTVAEVAGASPISKGLIEHWIPIEAVLAYRVIPVQPVPKGVIPDPPNYSACIAFLKANPSPREKAEGPRTQPRVKARCAQKQEELKRKVLGYMIAYRWVSGELKRRGLSLSKSEENKALRFFETYDFTPKEFHAYIAHSGETRADLHFIVEYTAMVTKLENDALAKKSMSETEQRAALADFTRRWTARTTCKPGYLVAGCKEYHGSETPL